MSYTRKNMGFSVFQLFFLKMGYSTKKVLSLIGFCTIVVVTYSEIGILSDNHIFNVKMRQIAMIPLKTVSTNENILLQLKLG